MSRSAGRMQAIRSVGTTALCAVWLCVCAACPSPAADTPSWRRAYVPADEPGVWPEGDWEPVLLDELNAFLAAESDDPALTAAQPVFSRAVYRGALTGDGACDGTLEIEVQRPSGAGEYLEIGDVSVVLSQLAWEGEPAVWGTAPDDRVLLQVARSAGTLTGRWSARGRQVFSRRDFDLSLPAAGSTRIELTLPSSLQLRSNAGVVLPPVDAGLEQRLWVVELGRLSRCTCTLQSASAPGAPLLHCDRSLVYSIRPDVCRIQADFSVHAQRAVPSELVFDVPANMQRAAATFASNTSLPSRLEVQGDSAVLRVPLARLAPGRIGTIRIVGEVPLQERTDWELPVVSLQNAALITGERRMHIDRPLTLSAVVLSDVRQTGLDADATGGDWFYEDLSATSAVSVRIGRPAVLTTARVLTRIDAQEDAAEFRAAIDLQCHSGSAFHSVFRMPAGWQVTDVAPAPQSAASGISSWSVSEGEGERWLDVEFRQAITPQATRRILVSGRWSKAGTDCVLESFPAPASTADSLLILAVAVPDEWQLTSVEGEGLQRLNAPPSAAWNELLESLDLGGRPAQYTWLAAGNDSGAALSITKVPEGVQSGDARESPSGDLTASPADGSGQKLRTSLSLHSAVSGLDAEWAWHVARYRLSPHAGGEELDLRLASPAQFDALTVDGAPHEVLLDGDRVQAAPLAATAVEVAVHYRTPVAADGSILQRTLRAPLPECNAVVSGFEWRIAAPHRLRLTENDVPWSIATEQWEPSWRERVLGPLARTETSSRFRPWDAREWHTLFDLDARVAESVNWSRMREIRIAAADAPQSASLTLVDARISRGLGWTTLIAALIAAVLIRRLHWSLLPPAVVSAIALIAALYADVPYVCMLSGAFTGFGLGCLLPKPVVERRDVLSRWVGESAIGRRRAAAASVASVILVLSTAFGLAQGQPGEGTAASITESVNIADDTVEILVPYHGETLGPAAYLRRDLLPQLQAWRDARLAKPEYLLRTARYATPPAEPETLQAEYEVVLLDQERPVTVRLPISGVLFRDLDRCRVNGQNTPLRPSRSATSWLVEIDDPPENEGESPQTASLVVSLRLPAGQPALEIGIPPVIDSSFHLTGRPPDQYETSAWGGVQLADDGTLQGALGGVSTLMVTPVGSGTPPFPGTSQLTGEAVSFFEVHPLRARIRTQLEISTPDGDSGQPSLRTLSLLLPGRAEVREVAAEGLRGYSAFHDSDPTTLLELEFQDAAPTSRIIHLDYTSALVNAEEAVTIPAIPLLDGGRLRSHRVGLRPTSGLALTRPLSSSVALQPLPVELFDAPDGGSWPAPDLAFVLNEPAPIEVRLQRIEPARSAALEQTLTIGSQEIAWRLSASIDVTSAPAYDHRLPVAAGARIDQVAVTQDGADRLLSWSREGDVLMVNVQSETVGRQELVITGQLPLDVEHPLPFPSSSIADATLSASELIIRNASPYVVKLLDDHGQVLSDGAVPAMAASQSDGASVRRLSLLPAEAPRALQLEAPAAAAPLHLHVVLEQVAGQWRMSNVFRAAAGSQLPIPFEIQAVPAVAAAIGVHPGVAASWPTAPPGGDAGDPVRVELRPADGGAWSECAVWLLLPAPDSPQWILPQIQPAAAPIAERRLTLPADAPLSPDPTTATRVQGEEGEAASQPPVVASDADTTTFSLSSSDIVLQHLPADEASCRIEFAETLIWCDREDQVAGLTTWRFTPQRARCLLEAQLPAQLQLLRVLWNGADVSPTRTSDATAIIEIQGSVPGTLHELQLHWRLPQAISGSRHRLSLQRPRPSELASGSELVSVLPPSHRDSVPFTQIGRQTDARFHLLRLETLLQLASEHVVEGGPGLPLLLDDIKASVAAATSSQPSGVEDSRRLSAAIRRWNELQRLSPIPQTDGTQPSPVVIQSVSPVRPDAVRMLIPTDVAGFDLWIIRQRTWMLAVVLLVFAGAALTFRRWSRWLAAVSASTPYAGLIVTGIVWWLWFIGSALGLLLLAVGLLLQIALWMRPRAPVAAEL